MPQLSPPKSFRRRTGFCPDPFSEFGLGPGRADAMVRARKVLDNGVPLAFHSDLPMAPAAPLVLTSYAVNRRTASGRIAGPEHRISVEEALRAITINAAYSWFCEHEIGSIAPGKAATFTVLDSDSIDVDPEDLAKIKVRGIVFEGKWMPVPAGGASAAPLSLATFLTVPGHVGADSDQHDGRVFLRRSTSRGGSVSSS